SSKRKSKQSKTKGKDKDSQRSHNGSKSSLNNTDEETPLDKKPESSDLMNLITSLHSQDSSSSEGDESLVTLFQFLRDSKGPTRSRRPNFERLPQLQKRLQSFVQTSSQTNSSTSGQSKDEIPSQSIGEEGVTRMESALSEPI